MTVTKNRFILCFLSSAWRLCVLSSASYETIEQVTGGIQIIQLENSVSELSKVSLELETANKNKEVVKQFFDSVVKIFNQKSKEKQAAKQEFDDSTQAVKVVEKEKEKEKEKILYTQQEIKSYQQHVTKYEKIIQETQTKINEHNNIIQQEKSKISNWKKEAKDTKNSNSQVKLTRKLQKANKKISEQQTAKRISKAFIKSKSSWLQHSKTQKIRADKTKNTLDQSLADKTKNLNKLSLSQKEAEEKLKTKTQELQNAETTKNNGQAAKEANKAEIELKTNEKQEKINSKQKHRQKFCSKWISVCIKKNY